MTVENNMSDHSDADPARQASRSAESSDQREKFVLVPQILARRNAGYSSKQLKDKQSAEQEASKQHKQSQELSRKTSRPPPQPWRNCSYVNERVISDIRGILDKLDITLDPQFQFTHMSNTSYIFRGRDKQDPCMYHLTQ